MARRREGTNWSLAMVIFIVFVMVFSTIGYIWIGGSDQGTTFKYNDYKFTRDFSGYHTKADGIQLDFVYSPQELENTTQDFLNRSSVDAVKGSLFVYMTSEMNDTYREDIASFEYQLSQLLEKKFTIFSQTGFTNETVSNIPVVDCRNVSSRISVLYLYSSDNTKTELNNGCVEISFIDKQDLAKTQDLFLYLLFGIIK